MKFREVLFFSRTFFLPKRLNLLWYVLKEHFDARETLPSSSLPRVHPHVVASQRLLFLVFSSSRITFFARACISSRSFLNDTRKSHASCSHLTRVFFFLTFYRFLVSLKYLSLLVYCALRKAAFREKETRIILMEEEYAQ